MKNQQPNVINFKIGRQKIIMKAGDYLYDNGGCTMLSSGDGRNMSHYRTSTMQSSRSTQQLNYVVLTKRFLKKLKSNNIIIDWSEVDRTECGRVNYKAIITQEWIDKNKALIELS
jgi:hypothetical protein